MSEDMVYVRDHEEGTRFQTEIYGYFAKLGDGKGGEQICFVASNCDVTNMGELINAGGYTPDSIQGRRLIITISDEP